jgi:hypothetical protein
MNTYDDQDAIDENIALEQAADRQADLDRLASLGHQISATSQARYGAHGGVS